MYQSTQVLATLEARALNTGYPLTVDHICSIKKMAQTGWKKPLFRHPHCKLDIVTLNVSKKISMNIPLNPKFSWLNSRWAAFPDPPVRWLWLLLAWAFREGWTKELMNGDRWCWSYLEKPQNWMNKYQNVEHLNVWWVKNDSIWWFHSTDWANRSVTCSSSSECGLVFSVCLIIGRNGKFSHYKPEANSQLSRLKTRAHASATCSARDTRGVEPWHWTVLRE